MGRGHTSFDPAVQVRARQGASVISFEIFIRSRFSAYEVSAITHTLDVANDIAGTARFSWRFVSDTPGLVTGANDMLIRAEPAIANYGFSDVMIVVGGKREENPNWIKRLRAMQRLARPVVLLSDAATSYITSTKSLSGKVTTHWRDAGLITEAGYHPNLTARFAENAGGIITAAGAGGTAEIIIGLISRHLDGVQIAELGNRLLLQTIRNSDAEQPHAIASNEGLFSQRITDVIKLMEDTISDPLPIPELTQAAGVSSRHLERLFREAFNETPARFYKRLRAKHARAMIEETLIPMIDIAVATGFGSSDTLSKAIKDEYGVSPSKMRARKKVDLLKFSQR